MEFATVQLRRSVVVVTMASHLNGDKSMLEWVYLPAGVVVGEDNLQNGIQHNKMKSSICWGRLPHKKCIV